MLIGAGLAYLTIAFVLSFQTFRYADVRKDKQLPGLRARILEARELDDDDPKWRQFSTPVRFVCALLWLPILLLFVIALIRGPR